MTPIVAHAGHWIANTLYAAPVLIVVGALVVQRIRDRNADEADRDGTPARHEPGPG